MNRLFLLLIGCFGQLALLSVLWAASPLGQRFLTGTGYALPDMRPGDLSLQLTLLAGLGFVPIAGYALHGLSNALARAVVGSHGGSFRRPGEDVRGMLSWGIFAYVAFALVFGGVFLVFNQNA